MPSTSILNKLLEYLDISVAKLESNIGVGATSLQKSIVRDSKLSVAVIDKICKRYPEISKEWLMTEKGHLLVKDRLVDEHKQTIKWQREQIEKQNELIKYLMTKIPDYKP